MQIRCVITNLTRAPLTHDKIIVHEILQRARQQFKVHNELAQHQHPYLSTQQHCNF